MIGPRFPDIALPTNPPRYPDGKGGYTFDPSETREEDDVSRMAVWMIWGTYDDPMFYHLIDAWDDDTVQDNRKGWEAAIEEAYETHGAQNVRVMRTTVNLDKVIQAFQPVDI